MSGPGRPFQKGQSGNPGGRHKGLAELVRDTVGDDMAAIIKAQVAIAKGQKPEGIANLPAIKPSDITKAAEWLADRGWGKAPQVVNFGSRPAGIRDYSGCSDEELDRMLAEDEEFLRRQAGQDGPRGED